ncbi:MAG: AAA family ATPase [Polyangiaceae bacterium]|nr:AAA family ATPase [Polyangiaceae bacterium]
MDMQISLGIDDFRALREGGFEYVDKTHFITELIDRRGIKVILVPRPRRFGKSLNISLLRWFFEKNNEDLWHLFEGLHVARAGEKYRAHFGQYPVVHISFKETKALHFDGCVSEAKRLIRDMYVHHAASLEGRLEPWAEAEFRAIVDGSADIGLYRRSLKNLTRFLHQVHGKAPIVLIDEYDAGIVAGYTNGFYTEAVDFFGAFYLAGLKDNPHLERAVMTGILRVSRESIFSELNNVGVYTLLAKEFNTCFGFTESEVEDLVQRAGISHTMDALRGYYNGYDFGGEAIYNPWSILTYLANEIKELMPYWINTSANTLVKELLRLHAFVVEKDIRTLLERGSIDRELDENIVFVELKRSSRALWNILVFTGYLKAVRQPRGPGQTWPVFRLSIPNTEVSYVYRTTFQSWMDEGMRAQGGAIEKLLDALLAGNVTEFEAQLGAFALYCVSFHDVDARDPERFYQGLMIGLLASLEPGYEVRSNRESGEGRPDVMIKPRSPGKPGVVLELKAARAKKTLKQALKEGHDQFRKSDYAAELRAAGVEQVHAMVIAFDGKQVKVELAKAPSKKSSVLRKAGQAIRKAAKKVTAKKRATRK